jgi:hypothetical protein
MTRATASRNFDRLNSLQRSVAGDRVDADNVGAQVRGQDVLSGRVGDDLVRVRSLLALRIGTGLLELVDLLLDLGRS